jgi:hypothetical protein
MGTVGLLDIIGTVGLLKNPSNIRFQAKRADNFFVCVHFGYEKNQSVTFSTDPLSPYKPVPPHPSRIYSSEP